MNWWSALLLVLPYLGLVAVVLLRAKQQYPGRQVRTMVVVENPDSPISADELQALVGTHGVVIPGFTITP